MRVSAFREQVAVAGLGVAKEKGCGVEREAHFGTSLIGMDLRGRSESQSGRPAYTRGAIRSHNRIRNRNFTAG